MIMITCFILYPAWATSRPRYRCSPASCWTTAAAAVIRVPRGQLNVFVYPAASEQQQRKGFTCPVFAVEVPEPQEAEVQLKRWLGLEPEVGGYRVAKVKVLFRGSLWDLSREAGREVFDAVGATAAEEEGAGTGAAGAGAAAAAVGGLPTAQVWEGKPVLNLEEVRARVLGWVESDRSELGSCGLCFS